MANKTNNKQVQSWLSLSSKLGVLTWRVPIQSRHLDPNITKVYRIYSINRPERLLNFWTLRQHQSKVSVNYSEENSVFREVSK